MKLACKAKSFVFNKLFPGNVTVHLQQKSPPNRLARRFNGPLKRYPGDTAKQTHYSQEHLTSVPACASLHLSVRFEKSFGDI